jgi:hypothetical protein
MYEYANGCVKRDASSIFMPVYVHRKEIIYTLLYFILSRFNESFAVSGRGGGGDRSRHPFPWLLDEVTVLPEIQQVTMT